MVQVAVHGLCDGVGVSIVADMFEYVYVNVCCVKDTIKMKDRH